MGIFGKLVNLAITTLETPIAVVKDVATMGGVLSDKDEPYTQEKLRELGGRVNKIKKELDN